MIKNDPTNSIINNEKLNGIYRGVIEDNVDPDKLGRCKIRIWGLHTKKKIKTEVEGIPTDELPWASPALSLFEGSQTGFGNFVVPLKGSHVFLFFEGGHILKPVYFASAPGKPTCKYHGMSKNEGFHDPDEKYPNESTEQPHKPNQLNESDYHRLARNEGIGETIVQSKTSKLDMEVEQANGGSWDEAGPFYKAEYPHNKVMSTHTGITVEIDDTNDEGRIHLYHPSNTYIEISPNGTIVFRNESDRYDITLGNKHSHVAINEHHNVEVDRTKNIGMDQYEWIGGSEYREVIMNTHETVDLNEFKKVIGNKSEIVNMNEFRKVNMSSHEMIGMSRITGIGVLDSRTVVGTSIEAVSGLDDKIVLGLSSEFIIGNKSNTVIGNDVSVKVANESDAVLGSRVHGTAGVCLNTTFGGKTEMVLGKNHTITIGSVVFNVIGTANATIIGPVSVRSGTAITVDAPIIALNTGLSTVIPVQEPILPTQSAGPSMPITPIPPIEPIPPKL